MQRSENLKEFAAALSRVQSEIKPATKDSFNPHFRSKYADLASVWDAVRVALSGNGFAVIQSPEASDAGYVSLETTLLHSSGQWVSSTLKVPLTKADAQGVGSAISYMRRYALAALVGVVADDDDGNAASEPPKPATAQPTAAQSVEADRLGDALQAVSTTGELDNVLAQIVDARLPETHKAKLRLLVAAARARLSAAE